MNSLALYIRKEWRDQRIGLLGLLVALPLLFAIVCAAGDGTPAVEELLRPGIAAACGALVVFFGVGTDLIPREVRGTRVGFLARLPAGLGRAFLAKLVFFAATTLVVASYAAGIALAASLVRNGALPEAFLGVVEERSVLLAIGLALWVVAASTWVQQGALAIPTAVVVAALLCSPAWFFFGPHSVLEPTLAEIRAFAALCALGSCASAGAAFVFGRRFGANQSARSVLAGALVAVASIAPAWLWSTHRLYAAHHCDPNDARFTIGVVRIDTSTVEGRVGSARETFTVDLHGVATPTGDSFAESVRDLGLDSGWRVRGWSGLGFALSRVGQNASSPAGYYELSRRQLFPAVERDARTRVWIREGRWLVRDGRTGAYELVDPSTRESTPADLSPADRLGPMLPDGRFLLASGGEVFVYDPSTSERQRLAIAGGDAIRATSVSSTASSPLRALESPFVVVWGDSRSCLARLDLERHELVPARGSRGSMLRLVGIDSDDSAIVVEDNRRLVRLRFGSDEREVLLPASP